MIDAHTALRTYLIAASPLRTLLGGAYVYWPELPASRSVSPIGKNIVFRFSGGPTSPYLPTQQARVNFRCYGASHVEAMTVYRALYDRLHAIQNVIVGDTGIYGAEEDTPGEPLEDPGTGWPFVFTVYTLRVATVPVTA